jgi:predicted MPP superfamily phosphohydrolase
MEIVIAVGLIILIGIYLYYENTTLEVTKYSIENGRLPSSFNNYKIVHISDFHNTKSQRLENSIISKIASENPDVIVITGDTIDSRRMRIDVAISFVKRLVKITDVYYIPGNHEARIEEYEALLDE